MALAFSRSLRALETDHTFGGALLWLFMLGLSAAWLYWFTLTRVQLLAETDRARVEVRQTGHGVQAPVSGRVLVSHQSLDRWVNAGDVLLELDSSLEHSELEQKRTELTGTQAELSALKQQVGALQQVIATEEQATRVHVDEAELLKQQAQALAVYRDGEEARTVALRELGALAEATAQKSSSEAEQQRRSAEHAALAIERIRADRAVAQAERIEHLSQLRTQAAGLQARAAALVHDIERDEHELERRLIRAPIAGRLGDVAALTAGSFVQAGDTLCAIVPDGRLRVSADFAAAQAVGRIRRGQTARMRLYGFPWTQYGTLHAVVEHVARESRDGRVRVELAADPESLRRVSLRHGMSGSLEIALKTVSPLELTWRAVGKAAGANGSGAR